MYTIFACDGCPGGWVTLGLDMETGVISVWVAVDIAAVCDSREWQAPAVLAIDMPIGLPEAGPRACDKLARERLCRPRCSSVFSPPIRPMLGAGNYRAACDIGERVDGWKLSRQAWNLMPKIREVDDFVRGEAGRAQWVKEAHPEVSFQAMNGGVAMAHNKKRPEGRAEREALVSAAFGGAYERIKQNPPVGKYAGDDLLDAFAVLWTARRIARGESETLPGEPGVDGCGVPMGIVV